MPGNWDGKTRPSNEKYRKNFEEIFGQKEQEELAQSMKQSIRNKEERLKKEEFNENNRDSSKDPYKGTNIEGKD